MSLDAADRPSTAVEETEAPIYDTTSTDSPTDSDDQNPRKYKPIGKAQRTLGMARTETSKSTKSEFRMDPEAEKEVRRIARTQTYTSSRGRAASTAGTELERSGTLAGVEWGDPVLDPTKPEFDIYKWLLIFLNITHEEDIKTREAGFNFKNLNISGTGNALQMQKDVTSPFMVPFRLGEYFSFGKKSERKIIRNFEGILRAGEMLVVLGRPGSGCSTFLKAITGQMHGLKQDKDSVIHYNGNTLTSKHSDAI
jgi:ABC-type glutathione transport system ATPase component